MARAVAGTPATVALTRAGIAFTVHAYDHDPRSASYGLEAARALGIAPDEVFKTLVVTIDGTPVVGVVPVSTTLDLKALAAIHGGRRADLIDGPSAQRLTGYVIGGISPIGQKRALPTYVDETAQLLDVMYVSGGRRGYDVGLSPADLIAVTSGRYARIGR